MRCQVCDFCMGMDSVYAQGLSTSHTGSCRVKWRPKFKKYMCDDCVEAYRIQPIDEDLFRVMEEFEDDESSSRITYSLSKLSE